MFPPDDPLPLATGGGMLQAGSPLLQAFVERLKAKLPRAQLHDVSVDAPLGALRLAAAIT
jgi:hypothetical protein